MKKTAYGDRAVHYDAWFETNWPTYQSELRAIKALMPPFDLGLEIGVGTGRFASQLGVNLGVDPSLPMIKIAARRKIDVIMGVAERLPFKDASFDLCLMITVIFLLSDMKAAFSEVHRVLKPGGSLILGFINKESKLGKFYEGGKKESAFYKNVHFHTPKEVCTGLESVGFRDMAFVQTLFNMPEEIKTPEFPKKGHGKGSFVVARGSKKKNVDNIP